MGSSYAADGLGVTVTLVSKQYTVNLVAAQAARVCARARTSDLRPPDCLVSLNRQILRSESTPRL